MGLIFFDDKGYFEVAGEKRFDRDRIIAFAREQGLAFFDTATKVRRLKGNASDNFLEIVEPTDVASLLAQLPQCKTIVTTGGKASEEFMKIIGQALQQDSPGEEAVAEVLPIGSSVTINAFGRPVEWYRMPSTSRAYPLSLVKKADFYRRLFTSAF